MNLKITKSHAKPVFVLTPILLSFAFLAYQKHSPQQYRLITHKPFISNTNIHFDTKGWTDLHKAATHKNQEALKKLLQEKTIDINKPDKLGRTALHHAAINGFAPGLKLLLKYGADIHIRDKKGRSPLHLAAGKNRAQWSNENDYCYITHLLLKAGSSINQQDKKGRTPLHYAAQYGYSKITALLLENKANTNIHDHEHALPLHYATGKKGFSWAQKQASYDIVRHLLTAKTSINATDNKGKTPIHYAAASGHDLIVGLLLKHRAHINIQDKKQATPLHYACGKDTLRFMPRKYAPHVKSIVQIKEHEKWYTQELEAHHKIIELLINNGALHGLQDNKNQFPCYYVHKHKHQKLFNALAFSIKNHTRAPQNLYDLSDPEEF